MMSEQSYEEDIKYLQQLSVTHIATRIFASGLQLGVFESIGENGKTAKKIAEDSSCSLRGIRVLLDCLVSLRLLRKSNDRYWHTTISWRFLRKSSQDYMGHVWENEQSLEYWNHLNTAVRTGKPLHKKRSQEEEAQSFSGLARSLYVVNQKPAAFAARALGAGTTHKGMKVLDVACGSGVWGIGIAEADPSSQIVALDFPAVIEITKIYVRQHNVENQFTYLPCDLHEAQLDASRFDLVILGNILHSEGEQKSVELLRRTHGALQDSGRVAIIDVIPDEQRTGPPSSLLVALTMLLDTEEGDLFTLPEYRAWLAEAGFEGFETADIGSHSPMIIATKK